MLETGKDMDPQSRKILPTDVCMVGGAGGWGGGQVFATLPRIHIFAITVEGSILSA